MANFLIDRGADVNAQGANGITPLHWAARSGNLLVARLLLDRGADVNVYDQYSGPIVSSSICGTVLQVAINSGAKNEEMASFLVNHGAKIGRKDT